MLQLHSSANPSETVRRARTVRQFDWRGLAWAVAVVAATTALGWPLHHSPRFHIENENILMLYLLGVVWIATRHSRAAAVVASVLSVLAFDLTFVPPYGTLAVENPQYILIFAVMLATALVISALTHQAREQAEAARVAWERAETEFLRNTLLSGVSHELRTPLAAITGSASTLIENRDHLDRATQADMLDTIYSESERMERLITNLLDMTRLESGGITVKKEWQPLQEVIGSALHRAERRLRGRTIRTSVPRDLPLVRIDTVLIEQVLMNLLDNAIEYTPTTGEISISAAASGDAVAVEVADAGPGIPAGTEQRVFQKFFRAARPDSRRGIGLGLAICRGIVEAHGGAIAARNRPEGGAAFRFTIPTTGDRPPAVDGAG
jgi:two-component system sensor histidine kinase KdpD